MEIAEGCTGKQVLACGGRQKQGFWRDMKRRGFPSCRRGRLGALEIFFQGVPFVGKERMRGRYSATNRAKRAFQEEKHPERAKGSGEEKGEVWQPWIPGLTLSVYSLIIFLLAVLVDYLIICLVSWFMFELWVHYCYLIHFSRLF